MKKTRFFSKLLVAGFVLLSQAAAAQDGVKGIQAATAEVQKHFNVLPPLIFVIAGVVGFFGGLKVYGKWNSGDQDTQKSAVSWFGSMIFIVLIGAVIKAFFGI